MGLRTGGVLICALQGSPELGLLVRVEGKLEHAAFLLSQSMDKFKEVGPAKHIQVTCGWAYTMHSLVAMDVLDPRIAGQIQHVPSTVLLGFRGWMF